MEVIQAVGLVNAGSALAMFYTPMDVLPHKAQVVSIDFGRPVSKDTAELYLHSFQVLKQDCLLLGLDVTLVKVERIFNLLEKADISYDEFAEACKATLERLRDELRTKLFLYISAEQARYYNNPLEQWSSVVGNFPSITRDIEEAAKCFAVNRYTGCVFHLMRIAEAGLSTIAKRVGLVNDRPNWEEAITYIEGQLNKNYSAMDSLFKGDTEFLSGVAAHMRDVNIAWRRRVSHVERNYTEEEAQRIFSTTKGLMEQISTKLSEVDST